MQNGGLCAAGDIKMFLYAAGHTMMILFVAGKNDVLVRRRRKMVFRCAAGEEDDVFVRSRRQSI